MSVRRAEKKDIGRIQDLLLQVNNVHAEGRPDIFILNSRKYTEEEIEAILSDEDRPVFAWTDQEDVLQGYAFCEFQYTPDDGHMVPMTTLYLDDLCVDESQRGTGIGKDLYNEVKRFAKEKGCYRVTLNVWECNPKAAGFYQKMGLLPLKQYMEDIL